MGLFLWHFVEEVEHRSSALLIYDAVVNDPWYRLRVAPSVFAHVGSAMITAAEGLNKHVPLEKEKSMRRAWTTCGAGKRHCDRSFRFSTPPTTGRAKTLTRTCGCVSSWPRRTGSCAARFRATIPPREGCPPWPVVRPLRRRL
jgi:hypothetical protein